MQSARLQRIKVIALPIVDPERAAKFYETVLGLKPAYEGGKQVGYYLGDIILMLKSNWYACPTQNPNPRITIETDDAVQMSANCAKAPSLFRIRSRSSMSSTWEVFSIAKGTSFGIARR